LTNWDIGIIRDNCINADLTRDLASVLQGYEIGGSFRMVTEFFGVAGAIIASLGGGAAIVYFFSTFLGKLWADRIIHNEIATHNEELEDIRLKAGAGDKLRLSPLSNSQSFPTLKLHQ